MGTVDINVHYFGSYLFDRLSQHIAKVLISYLSYQVKAGARMVQIFDSWAGALSEADYRRYALPTTQVVIAGFKALHPETPLTLYVGNSGHILDATAESGADVLSLDWRVDLNWAAQRVGHKVALQGNLDPCRLFSTREDVEQATRELLDGFAWKTGHIFNLGHGILPGTPVENVKCLVETVQSYGL